VLPCVGECERAADGNLFYSILDSIVFSGALTRMCNWASYGPDGNQGYWWKRMVPVHTFLGASFDKSIITNTVSSGQNFITSKD